MILDKLLNAGVLRGFLTIAFALALIAGFLTDRVSVEVFVPIATVSLTYYFARKQDEADSDFQALAGSTVSQAKVNDLAARVEGLELEFDKLSTVPFVQFDTNRQLLSES